MPAPFRPGPSLTPAEWIPIAEASALLGVSARQIQRREQAGNIEKRFGSRVGSAGAPVLYSRADVEALKAGTPNVHAREVTNSRPGLLPSQTTNGISDGGPGTALSLAQQQRGERWQGTGVFADALAVLLSKTQPSPAPRPWLTLAEAVEYSGLPRAFLLARAIEGVPWALDVGQGGARAFWRFNREGLKEAK